MSTGGAEDIESELSLCRVLHKLSKRVYMYGLSDVRISIESLLPIIIVNAKYAFMHHLNGRTFGKAQNQLAATAQSTTSWIYLTKEARYEHS